MRKILLVAIIGIILTFFVSGCVEVAEPKIPDTIEETPTHKIENSLERQLINKWLEEVEDPNNVMWLYHMSYTGQLIGEFPVVGKPVSMTKSNEPKSRLVADNNGNTDYFEEEAAKGFIGYRAGTTETANPSGTYGGDLPGLFFYTPDAGYHEIHDGIIHVSSTPLIIKDQLTLTYDIDKDKQAQEQRWEESLKKHNPVVEKAKNQSV